MQLTSLLTFPVIIPIKNYQMNTISPCEPFVILAIYLYSGRSPRDHSCKQSALVTNSIVKPHLNCH